MPPDTPHRYSTQVICPYTSANQVGAMLWLGFILFLIVFPKVKYFYFEKNSFGKSRVSNCGDSCSGRRRSRNQKVLWGRNKLHSPLKRDIFAFSLYLHHTTKSDILIFAFFLSSPPAEFFRARFPQPSPLQRDLFVLVFFPLLWKVFSKERPGNRVCAGNNGWSGGYLTHIRWQ